jgi:uncharacterized protein YdhG (YjbR/CyaY superfamily)
MMRHYLAGVKFAANAYNPLMPKPKTVSEYIATAPKEGRAMLREMRAILKKAAPGAAEAMKCGAPTFSYKRILFAYAGFKSHIGFMPTPPVVRAFAKELKKYATGKGSVQFPYGKPLPKALILKMARMRVKESKEKDVRWM